VDSALYRYEWLAAYDLKTQNTLSNSVSTLLRRSLSDVFGENDPVRCRAAVDEIFHEDAVFYDPKRRSSSLFQPKPEGYSLRLGFFVSSHVFRCLPIRLRYFAKSVSKKRGDQKEQDLQGTLPGRVIWSPMSAEEKRAAFPVRLVDIPERQVAYIRVMMPSNWTEYLPPSRQ
jgi:hypothetical protein